ncbi:MAG: hypothetical protein IJ784_13880 [Ruminiclostridium sp.]|nr:hypothetical protein [Ruminiclostridium sp.]
MTESKKDSLSAFFAKDKKRDSFRKTIEDYVIWQLAALPDKTLADTTADEIIKGIFDMKKICQTVISHAQKQKSGNSAALASYDVFWIVCKELHINGVITKEDTLGFVPDGFTRSMSVEVHAHAKTKEKLQAPAKTSPFSVDIDSLFDD